MRVASLLPSATEIVCALGAQDTLVGVSHECDFPAGVADLPALTRARLKPVTTSRDIDTEVRAILQDALAVYEIELDRLATARPELIVTQDLCDVCAVSLDDVRAAVAKLAQRDDIRIVNLHPMRLGDVWDDIARVAAALARPETGAHVVGDLRARVADIQARSAVRDGRPRVLSIEWIDPVMIGGMWMPELIALAGGTALVTKPADHAPTLTREALAALAPNVVLVKPCGFSLGRTLDELETLRAALPWNEWAAVRAGRVYVADGNAYFNRPGPRLVESLEILAACVHPETFPDFQQKHRGTVVRVEPDLRCEPW
jgi:iron complex transport system substrate-binding protein